MKITLSAIAGSLLFVGAAAAAKGRVFIFDSQSVPRTDDAQIASLSSVQTGQVLAQRLGLSEFYSLGNSGKATIEALNAYGGSRQNVFGNDETSTLRIVIVVEGVPLGIDEHSFMLPGFIKPTSQFEILDAPRSDVNRRFLRDLKLQAEHIYPSQETIFGQLDSSILAIQRHLANTTVSIRGDIALVHIRTIEAFVETHGSSSPEIMTPLSQIRDILTNLLQSHHAEMELALLEMPTPERNTNKHTSASYGKSTYLQRRQEDVDRPSTENDEPTDDEEDSPAEDYTDEEEGEGQYAEEDDSDGTQVSSSLRPSAARTSAVRTRPSPTPVVRPAQDDDDDDDPDEPSDDPDDPDDDPEEPEEPEQPPPRQNVTAPRGILPACFSTQAVCETRTHNCSGHGSCSQKYAVQDGDRTLRCFSCSCVPTTREAGKGVKTTIWSGPACQKKDISMPFWLLGGLTVFLVVIISWAVGLLYSMGSEELPSVIGAGVAGPRAQK